MGNSRLRYDRGELCSAAVVACGVLSLSMNGEYAAVNIDGGFLYCLAATGGCTNHQLLLLLLLSSSFLLSAPISRDGGYWKCGKRERICDDRSCTLAA